MVAANASQPTIARFYLCSLTREVRYVTTSGFCGIATVNEPCAETCGRPWLSSAHGLTDRQADELCELAYWGLYDGLCRDARFAGWEADCWAQSDADYDAQRAQALLDEVWEQTVRLAGAVS